MIELNYRIDPAEVRRIQQHALSSLDGDDLDFYLFCGDVLIKINNSHFDASWGWVPVLDFAVKLKEALLNLRIAASAKIEFTESDACINLRRTSGNNIEVTSNYCDAVETVTFSEFESKVYLFCEELYRGFVKQWPELEENEAFQQRKTVLLRKGNS